MRFLKQTLFAALLSPCLATTAGAAVFAYDGHDYQVVTASDLTWEAARSAAQALGSGWDLATIGTAGENAFLEGLLGASISSRAHYWLGATDAETEGAWKWIDGTAWSFADWGSGEPNNASNEDYLAFDWRNPWAWNDAPTHVMTSYNFDGGYVAERRPESSVPLPGTLPLLVCGLAGLHYARRRKPAV